ncbi:MAG: acetoacetyl-CoA reductase [Halochromatium sp.]|uniref:acetoacetyl-CoA reductase n=1 Tax=Halochromatium sp. TaxID=2049430 RepID=UPI0039791868
MTDSNTATAGQPGAGAGAGRVALVTGGIGGIGTAICRRLAQDGWRVVANHHPSEREAAQAWRNDLAGEGLRVDTIAADVSDFEDCGRMIATIKADQGPVSALINCAGITRDKTFKKMDEAQWRAVIEVNLGSVFNVTRQVWEDMLEAGFGRVVNISSVNGQRGQFGQANYAAAKAGMHGITMTLAQEGAAKGVTVNTVSPGYVETPMTLAMRDDVREAIVASVPMRRMGRPDEIASAVAFLVDEANGYVTGANLPVNGGLFMH